MSYHLYLGESITPPRSEADLRNALRSGELSPEVFCAKAGWPEWKTLGEVFGVQAPATPPPLPLAPRSAAAIETVNSAPPFAAVRDGAVREDAPVKPRRRWLMETIKLFFVGVFGLMSSIVLGAVLAAVELASGLALYSFTLWVVIPVGALATGIGGAAGSYYAARWFNYYPRFLFFFMSMAIAVGTQAAIYFMVWRGTVVDGVSLAEQVTFVEYLELVAKDVAIVSKFSRGEGVSLGETGSLIYFGLQTLGFMFGGLCVFAFLRERPYCHHACVYKKKAGVRELYELSPEAIDRRLPAIKALLEQGRFHEALSQHPIQACQAKRGYAQGARSVLTLFKHRKSPTTTIRHEVFVCVKKNEWKEISELKQDFETKLV